MIFLDFCPGWLTNIHLYLLGMHGKHKHEHPFAESYTGSQETAGVAWGSGNTYSNLTLKSLTTWGQDRRHSPTTNPGSFHSAPLAFEKKDPRFNKPLPNTAMVWESENQRRSESLNTPRKAVKAPSPYTLPCETTEQTQLLRSHHGLITDKSLKGRAGKGRAESWAVSMGCVWHSPAEETSNPFRGIFWGSIRHLFPQETWSRDTWESTRFSKASCCLNDLVEKEWNKIGGKLDTFANTEFWQEKEKLKREKLHWLRLRHLIPISAL